MEPDYSPLRVQVVTARGGIPVQDAYIRVYSVNDNGETDNLLATRFTNNAGITSIIFLQTPPKTDPFILNIEHAGYSTYCVYITKPNFHALQIFNVAMFPETPSVLPIHLRPLENTNVLNAPTQLRSTPLQNF